jgi:hypothetical protein
MGKVRALLNSFASGILSPRLDGRVDLDIYRKGAKTLTNFIPWPLGAAQNRSGSKFIARTKDDGQARLIPFVLGQNEEYAVKVGNGYMRFYENGAQITANLDFVAGGLIVGGASSSIFSSQDGSAWTDRPVQSSSTVTGIAWSDSLGLFVATTDTGLKPFTSPDGVNWTNQEALNADLKAVVWFDNSSLFCAVGASTGGDAELYISADGETWTERNNPEDITLRGVAANSNRVIAVGDRAASISSAYIITSTSTLLSWSRVTNTKDFGLNAIAWSESLGLWCAVGDADGTDAYMLTSPSTPSFTERSNPKNFALNDIAWSPTLSLFCAVGVADGTDAYIVTSSDGITWAERSNPKNFDLQAVAWSEDNALFCAVGLTDGTDAYMITSADGITWTEVSSPTDANLYSIVSRGTSTPAEIESPYLTAELFDIAFEQKENVLYLVHENHPPQQLTRVDSSENEWNISVGGLFSLNEFIMFVEPLADFAVSPSAQITVNAVDTGINNLAEITADASVFKSGDRGKRIRAGSGVARIVYLMGDGSATGSVVLVDIESTFSSASYASGDWELVGGGNFLLNPSAKGNARDFIDLVNDTAVNITDNLVEETNAKWSASGSGTNEYYLLNSSAFYPPGAPGEANMLDRGVEMFKNNAGIGSLEPGEWAWGDNDGLGYSTLYVRLTNELDPDDYRAINGNPSRRHWLIRIDPTVTPIVTAAGNSTLASEVGGFVSIQGGLAEIVSNLSTRSYKARVMKVLDSADGTHVWTLEGKAFSATNGYPGAVIFHEDRLYFAGTDANPLTLWGSKVGDYDNFIRGTSADESVAFTLNAKEASKIVWLISRDILIAGTEGGEWQIGLRGVITTPSNIYARKQTPHGSDIRYPIVAQSNILFVERGNRKLRELTYAFDNDSYRAPDRLLFAEHIAVDKIKQLTYQPRNNSIVFGMLESGEVIGMAYEPDFDVFAWFTMNTGMDSSGAYDGTDDIESVTVIADSNGVKELWAVVKRVVDAGTIRTVEVFKNLFDSDTASNARMLDSYIVDTSLSTTVSGLDHLIGDVVTFIIDGDSTKISTATVDGDGEIDISATGTPSTNVVVGIPYTSTLQTMRIEGGGQRGSSQGKKKRIWEVIMRLYRSMGGKVGTTSDLTKLEDIANVATLTTDDRDTKVKQGYSTDGIVTVAQTQPLPITITAMFPEIHENER